MSEIAKPYVRKKTCPEEDISPLIGEQSSGDSIYTHTHTAPKKPTLSICPLLASDCVKESCEWWMAADDECAVYRIARCIL